MKKVVVGLTMRESRAFITSGTGGSFRNSSRRRCVPRSVVAEETAREKNQNKSPVLKCKRVYAGRDERTRERIRKRDRKRPGSLPRTRTSCVTHARPQERPSSPLSTFVSCPSSFPFGPATSTIKSASFRSVCGSCIWLAITGPTSRHFDIQPFPPRHPSSAPHRFLSS